MAKLKNQIRPNGPSTLLEGKIADDVAIYLLESGKATEADFEKLPEGYKAIKKETVLKVLADLTPAQKAQATKKANEDAKKATEAAKEPTSNPEANTAEPEANAAEPEEEF